MYIGYSYIYVYILTIRGKGKNMKRASNLQVKEAILSFLERDLIKSHLDSGCDWGKYDRCGEIIWDCDCPEENE